jgi:SAM-dependent methyltransferase
MDAIQFARRNNDLYVIDLSPKSVSLTLGRIGNENLFAHAAVADAENLPFGGGSFDVVYSYGVLHHSPNTGRAIGQLHRALKPGGKAIVMLYAKYSAMVFVQVGLHRGIREGHLLATRSWSRLLSEWTELQSRTEHSANPLTQVFSVAECRRFFHEFASVRIEKHYLTTSHLAEARHLCRLLPQRVLDRLPGLLGWNLIIRAVK